jgi:PAS domain S-box-containing protein
MSFRLDPHGELVVDAAASAGIAVLLLAVDGTEARTLYVNEVFARWIGEPADAVTLKPPMDHVAPEDRERIRATFARRIVDPSVPRSLECTIVATSGELIPVAIGVARGEWRGRIVQIVLLTDVRDRRVAAAKLSASEKRFRALLEVAPDGVVILQRGLIRYANRAAGALLGLPEAELLGRSLGEFMDDDEVAVMRERLDAMKRGEQFAPRPYRARRKDGTTVVAEIASILVEHDGAPAVLAIARDVTDRAALAAQLERTERLAALGRLSAGMAHEINNPLAFVSLSTESLERRLRALSIEPETRRELAGLIENIARGTARVATIVRDLKAFSRDGEADRGPSALDDVLSTALRLVAHELSTRATVKRETPTLPHVAGAAGKLEQVFVNLLLNAAQAIPEDRMGHIMLRATIEPDAVVVSVADDGVGIPREQLDRVFDPFFTTKPVGVGTGLGLSICHGIVTAVGGSIRIESEERRGTVVHVRLPRAAEEPAIAPAPVIAPSSATRRRRVLIVEDQAALARTLAQALRDRYDVAVAGSVHDAVALAEERSEPPDVILCDMLLPDGTGADVHERIIASAPSLAERFVFMTGGAFLPRLAEFLERVPNARIHKPFALPALEELLEAQVRAVAP